ncbi:MAG: hypothetical protein FWE65_03195 [Eggerthellaceae bacterium]|nr:hypothetical protein [Eggerthellaceae bacterium]
MIDFTDFREDLQGCDGDEKVSILYEGGRYLLKFGEPLPNAAASESPEFIKSPCSEDIGCKIFTSFGFNTQATLGGSYEGRQAVACEDFLGSYDESIILREFRMFQDSFPDSDSAGGTELYPDIAEIEAVFERHPLLADVSEPARAEFWEMFIVDAFIGNPDRHTGNWAYLVDLEDNSVFPAPIFGCGSSLCAHLDDKELCRIVAEKDELEKLVLSFPMMPYLVGGKQMSYGEYLLEAENPHLDMALRRIVPKMRLDIVIGIIESCTLAAPERRKALVKMLEKRHELIIVPAYKLAAKRSRR